MKLLSTLSAIMLLFSSLTVSAGSDQGLTAAYPGNKNTKLIKFIDIKSSVVKEALQSVDLAFEKGDGYYDVIKSALYMVFTQDGRLAGFMEAALLSYTEGPQLYLVAAFVNTSGAREGGLHDLNSYNGYTDGTLRELPLELQPSID